MPESLQNSPARGGTGTTCHHSQFQTGVEVSKDRTAALQAAGPGAIPGDSTIYSTPRSHAHLDQTSCLRGEVEEAETRALEARESECESHRRDHLTLQPNQRPWRPGVTRCPCRKTGKGTAALSVRPREIAGHPGKPNPVSFGAGNTGPELYRKMGDAPSRSGKCSTGSRASQPGESPRKHRRLRVKGRRTVRGDYCHREPCAS